MAHAEVCPVCKGSGRIGCDSTSPAQACHGCNGLGWVTIGEEYPAPAEPRGVPDQPYIDWLYRPNLTSWSAPTMVESA